MFSVRASRIAALLVALGSAANAQAEAGEARRREELLRQLGLDKKPVEAVAPKEEPAPTPSSEAPKPKRAAPPTYVPTVEALLTQRCASCHKPEGMAGKTGLVISGDAARDHAEIVRLVDGKRPAASLLVTKAVGEAHGGGKILGPESKEVATLVAWIAAGAPFDGKRASPKKTVVEVAAPTSEPLPAEPATPESPSVTPEPVESPPVGPSYVPAVREVLHARCASCHGVGGMAYGPRLMLNDNAAGEEARVRTLIDVNQPARSLLVTKALGEVHAGGAVLAADSAEAKLLVTWIEAQRPAESVAEPDAPEDAPEDAPVAAAPSAADAPAPAAPPEPPATLRFTDRGLSLPGGLLLNGRFDLSYERLGYHDHPFQAGVNALRSYHHFLFLSHDGGALPFSFTAEVTSLLFWEARWQSEIGAARIGAKVGRLLLPFGKEPLFHQSYGGSAGFDQRVLPAVFASEGLGANGQMELLGVLFSADLYVVRGHGLRSEDGVLSLAGDISPIDDVQLAYGGRLGASYGPLTAWYSALYNPLGFERQLFLQAIDVQVFRPASLPVLRDLALGLGLLRADVSGAGVGEDYYHFASYLELRYYPWSFLHFFYRQGLRTFDNRRGLYFDRTRMSAVDSSTHNFGIVGRYANVSVGLYHFWNLEKVDEIADDFTRLTVAYEF